VSHDVDASGVIDALMLVAIAHPTPAQSIPPQQDFLVKKTPAKKPVIPYKSTTQPEPRSAVEFRSKTYNLNRGKRKSRTEPKPNQDTFESGYIFPNRKHIPVQI
jgi:hypothetical protein